MAKYAENTSVPTSKSRDEIERTLTRYGATAFAYGWEGAIVTIGFKTKNRQVRFRLTMPDRNSKEFTTTNNDRDKCRNC